jgi:nickel superoxide dismutase
MKKSNLKMIMLVTGALLVMFTVSGTHQAVFAHCQIPCGIYNDGARFVMLEEHVTTIEKSMRQIAELSYSSPETNTNQIVRWVANKEHHADELADIVVKYFLQQRVKPVNERSGAKRDKYVKHLTLCHGLLVTSMKAKQTTDLAHVEQLKKMISEFKESYLN